MDYQEALKSFERLKKEQEDYLESFDERKEKWSKFKDDYIALKNRLETLPHQLKYDIMVPVSKLGFMPGKLVHTNEILVLLGENWFVERSAKQACEIIERRLENIEKFIEDLEKEKKKIADQMSWTKDLMKEREDFVNIEEKLSEKEAEVFKRTGDEKRVVKSKMSQEEMKELRRKQQEKALKFQESINELLKKDSKAMFAGKKFESDHESETDSDDEPSSKKTDDDEFLKKFVEQVEDLDLGEKFEQIEEPKIKPPTSTQIQTFEEMLKDYESQIDRRNNEEMEKMMRFNFSREAEAKIGSKKAVKWSDIEKSQSENEEEDEEVSEEKEIPEPIHIQVHHTKNEKLDEIERNKKVSRDKPSIETPADIYNVFHRPKSILKRPSIDYSSDDALNSNKVTWTSDNFPSTTKKDTQHEDQENQPEFKFEPHKAFTGEIIERPFVPPKTDDTSTTNKRPLSKFKASKQNQ